MQMENWADRCIDIRWKIEKPRYGMLQNVKLTKFQITS